jgi:DNA-binding response OmpR family regulator
MLSGAGYSFVASTLDPREVCALHERNHYDLILLDLQMPGMDGFQVLEGLARVEKHGYLSVLVMTAHPGHKRRALEAGAKDFISKPFNAVEVLTRVYNLLELRLLHVQGQRNTAKRIVQERSRPRASGTGAASSTGAALGAPAGSLPPGRASAGSGRSSRGASGTR